MTRRSAYIITLRCPIYGIYKWKQVYKITSATHGMCAKTGEESMKHYIYGVLNALSEGRVKRFAVSLSLRCCYVIATS